MHVYKAHACTVLMDACCKGGGGEGCIGEWLNVHSCTQCDIL